jgi:hypothetical protein
MICTGGLAFLISRHEFVFFLLAKKQFSKIIVHGHTRMPELDIRFNRINVDTGTTQRDTAYLPRTRRGPFRFYWKQIPR